MTLSRRDVGDVHLGDAGAIGYGERRRSGQLPGTVIPHAGPAASTPLALAITMIEPALVGPTVPSPRGTIRPTSGGPSAKRSAVNLPAITWRTDREERAAQRTASKPKVEHVLACADLLPRSSSQARLHASMRPRSTWKAGSCSSWPSPYRRLDVVPGGSPPYEISCRRTSGRRSHGSEWSVTARRRSKAWRGLFAVLPGLTASTSARRIIASTDSGLIVRALGFPPMARRRASTQSR